MTFGLLRLPVRRAGVAQLNRDAGFVFNNDFSGCKFATGTAEASAAKPLSAKLMQYYNNYSPHITATHLQLSVP